MIHSIVLAEDNLEHCFFFERALREVAPETKFAAVHDSEKLIQLLDSYLPDLLFLDLGLPCKSGVECIKEVRDHREYDSLPIIVFSVNADEQTIQAAYGYGANLYVVKPGEYILLRSFFKRILAMDWSDPKTITRQYFERNRYVPFGESMWIVVWGSAVPSRPQLLEPLTCTNSSQVLTTRNSIFQTPT